MQLWVNQISNKLCGPSPVPNLLPFLLCLLAGRLWQGSVTSQPPRTRSFSCAWSSLPQFNRSARYLALQHTCSQPLGNIQTHTHNSFFHWAHTSPGAQTCRIKCRRRELWEMWSGSHDISLKPAFWAHYCKCWCFSWDLFLLMLANEETPLVWDCLMVNVAFVFPVS